MNAVAQYQECPTMSAEGTKSAATGSPESLEEPSAARRSNVPPPIPTTLDSPVASLAVYCAKLPNSYVNSFCGAMGGMASGIVTCPLDVIKTRLQAQGSFRRATRSTRTSGTLYRGMLNTAHIIWKEDGIRGMYRGLGPMLLGYLPTWAVYMAVYDSSREYYYTKMGTIRIVCPILVSLTVCRKQVVRSNMGVDNRRSMLNFGDESYLGDQDPSHVASESSSTGRSSNTMELPLHL